MRGFDNDSLTPHSDLDVNSYYIPISDTDQCLISTLAIIHTVCCDIRHHVKRCTISSASGIDRDFWFGI